MHDFVRFMSDKYSNDDKNLESPPTAQEENFIFEMMNRTGENCNLIINYLPQDLDDTGLKVSFNLCDLM